MTMIYAESFEARNIGRPFSSNNQPWRFIYAKRNTEKWDRLFNLMFEGNKIWTKNVVRASSCNFEKRVLNKMKNPQKRINMRLALPWENLAHRSGRQNSTPLMGWQDSIMRNPGKI